VVSDADEQERIENQWMEFGLDMPLEIVHSPYRELTRPIMRFIDELDARYDNDIITVVIPEFVVGNWWSHLLHNQSALFLKGRLLFRKGIVVTSVPYHLDDQLDDVASPSPAPSAPPSPAPSPPPSSDGQDSSA
jgi:hypothetical protein